MGKRIFDFVVAFVLLVCVAPLFPSIALWIRATSCGPVIFRQVRIGYRGVPFTVFKFRTMIDKSGRPLDRVAQNDPRITVPGTFLRKSHMDELPQLVNVLLGQMSLVGPRPLQYETVQKCAQEYAPFMRRYEVLPGITGLAQIRGRMWLVARGTRCSSRLDIFYIDHRSAGLDLFILAKTVRTVLECKGG